MKPYIIKEGDVVEFFKKTSRTPYSICKILEVFTQRKVCVQWLESEFATGGTQNIFHDYDSVLDPEERLVNDYIISINGVRQPIYGEVIPEIFDEDLFIL